MVPLYSHLECTSCKNTFDKYALHTYCTSCNQPLSAIYNLDRFSPEDIIDTKERSMWRYRKLMPVLDYHNIVSLGEGGTPMLQLHRISQTLGLEQVLIMKDESGNPTGSFKARGMSAAISKAKELGITQCCTPTAGNAGSAMAAYCAKAGMKAKVYMPVLTPKMFLYDTQLMGAEVISVDGSIRDAGLLMQQENKEQSMWDLSTMKEPFRLEGKKTMGYEIAEQLNWQLPDVILYPTGGGTGLIGIWKAFQEMLQMGWISYIPTRMVAVQLEGCDPIVKAFEASSDVSQLCENPMPTAANGLRVPKAFADKMVLDVIYKSEGFAVRVSESDMIQMIKNLAVSEGFFISPEGAALFCGLQQSLENGHIQRNEKVVVINTGSGYKYVENLW